MQLFFSSHIILLQCKSTLAQYILDAVGASMCSHAACVARAGHQRWCEDDHVNSGRGIGGPVVALTPALLGVRVRVFQLYACAHLGLRCLISLIFFFMLQFARNRGGAQCHTYSPRGFARRSSRTDCSLSRSIVRVFRWHCGLAARYDAADFSSHVQYRRFRKCV